MPRSENQILKSLRAEYRQYRKGLNIKSPTASPKRALVLERTKGVCFYCGLTLDAWTYEHLIPVSLGGGNALSNLVAACRPCNQARGNSPEVVKFLKNNAFLALAKMAEELIRNRARQWPRATRIKKHKSRGKLVQLPALPLVVTPCSPHPITELNP